MVPLIRLEIIFPQLRHHLLNFLFVYLAIVLALDKAIDCHLKGTGLSPLARHEFIQRTYNWTNIANRTELVYDNVHQQPPLTTGQLLRKYENNFTISPFKEMKHYSKLRIRAPQAYRGIFWNFNVQTFTRKLILLTAHVGYFLLSRYRRCGLVAGPFFVLLITVCHLVLRFLDWFLPRNLIDIAPDYKRSENVKKLK